MNKEFIWTDALIKEMIYRTVLVPEHYFGDVQKCLDEFKASYTPEVKRDWQIECFTDGKRNWWLQPNGFYTNQIFERRLTESQLVRDKDIWAVRRLSDNEVFFVGDIDIKYGKIKSFYIIDDGAVGVRFEEICSPDNLLSELSKLPQRTTEKLPLGVMPEWRHKELRLEELDAAINRYVDAMNPVPINWIAESYALRNWLENRKEEKGTNNKQ